MIITDQVLESTVKDAVSEIEGLDNIIGDVTRIRVESLDG